ncbi:MAG: hypothetical protein NWQ46_08075 [Spirosomaceae bacterium]|nr:hypothetical protein [Spirosomataceae bacterium]
MNDFSSKYHLLDSKGKAAVDQYIDSLLDNSKLAVQKFNTAYKKRILAISTWTAVLPQKDTTKTNVEL